MFFVIFYDAYLEILRLKIYFENCAKSKSEKHLETEGVQKMMKIMIIVGINTCLSY